MYTFAESYGIVHNNCFEPIFVDMKMAMYNLAKLTFLPQFLGPRIMYKCI